MQGQTNPAIIKSQLQRRLRNAATDAERALWRHLRGRRVQGCKFRRQHPFGDYILDFVCLDRKVVVELDGGQHVESTEHDAIRTGFLESAGFVVLRFWNNEVFGSIEGVVEVIDRSLAERADINRTPSSE